MSNKTPDMSVFIGRDFDCEKAVIYRDEYLDVSDCVWLPFDVDLSIVNRESYKLTELMRPRLNKPQVLDDYSWLPDGFAWEVAELGFYHSPFRIKKSIFSSKQLRCFPKRVVAHITCIGVEPEYADWGKQHGMEVVE